MQSYIWPSLAKHLLQFARGDIDNSDTWVHTHKYFVKHMKTKIQTKAEILWLQFMKQDYYMFSR